MKCIQCDADLRPGARFCNVCGAVQPQPDEVETAEDASGAEEEGATRVKRPARVPRPTLAPSMEASAEDDDSVDAEADASDVADALEGIETPTTLDEVETETLTRPPDVENVETSEYAVIAAPLPAASTPEQPEAASEPIPAWDPGGFSWPLPLQIIKGGRYRVEQVIRSTPDPSAGENIYRVRDLQGYERCWSCRATFGPERASESFCSVCGADLYGRPLRMYERLVDTHDAAAASNAAAPSDDGDSAAEAASPEEHSFVDGSRAYRVVPEASEASLFPMGPRFLVGMGADVGKTRPGEQNEDSIGALTLTLGIDSRMLPVALVVVADGMGGHASGQEASRLVVRTLTDYVLRQLALPFLSGDVTGDESDDMLKGLLFEAARTANQALYKTNSDLNADSGCTLVAALIVDDTAYIVNVGDSRAYALSDGALTRITVDHSLVEQLIAGGIVKPEDRYTHPQRNKIYKSLGDDPALQPDTFVQRLKPGMRLLLCCDGVWEMVHDDELARLLTEAPDPQQAVDALVARANENGGEDNISAIVVEARA